jgi:hypothetical protein
LRKILKEFSRIFEENFDIKEKRSVGREKYTPGVFENKGKF